MPRRPSNEEIEALYGEYLNLGQLDPSELWRGVNPELTQHVFRPVDVINTLAYAEEQTSGPAVATFRELSFNTTMVDRIAVIRQVFWGNIGILPDSLRVFKITPAATIDMFDDQAPPADFIFAGGRNSSPAWQAMMPMVLYPLETLVFRMFRGVAASLDMRVELSGEEFERPLRNVGT